MLSFYIVVFRVCFGQVELLVCFHVDDRQKRRGRWPSVLAFFVFSLENTWGSGRDGWSWMQAWPLQGCRAGKTGCGHPLTSRAVCHALDPTRPPGSYGYLPISHNIFILWLSLNPKATGKVWHHSPQRSSHHSLSPGFMPHSGPGLSQLHLPETLRGPERDP